MASSSLFLLMPALVWAQENTEEVEIIESTCQISGNVLSKLALYGIPLVVLGIFGFVFSKMWGKAAVERGAKPSSHMIAGWGLGFFISTLSFTGLLFALGQKVTIDADGIESIVSGSCFPDGWTMITGILVLVGLITFIMTKINAK